MEPHESQNTFLWIIKSKEKKFKKMEKNKGVKNEKK